MKAPNKWKAEALLGIVGAALFIACGLWVYTSGLQIEQISVTAIHTDSFQYLCYGIQLAPLDYPSANRMMAEVLSLADLTYLGDCFASDGSPELILESYYTRVSLSLLLAAAATLGLPLLVYVVPLLLFGALGYLWGYAVGGLPIRWVPLGLVILVLPPLSLAFTLWLSSMMTEGLFTLIVIGALVTTHLYKSGSLSPRYFAGIMISSSIALSLTRPSWIISGCFLMLALTALLKSRSGRFQRASATGRFLVMSAVLALSSITFLMFERLLPRAVTPSADFPIANQPQNTLPLRPDELLLIARVFLDVQIAGVQQALHIGDVGSVLLLFASIVAMAVLVIRRNWAFLLIVGSTWVVSIATSGVLALCCGGLGSYFRFSITSISASIFAAILSVQEPSPRDLDHRRGNTSAGNPTNWLPHRGE